METVCSSLVQLISRFLEMEDIATGAIGGAIAGVVAAGILGFLGWLHRFRLRRRDEAHIRDVVTQGRMWVMGSKDNLKPGMGIEFSADKFRAAQYNLMIKQLDVALERTTPNLDTNQRKDIFDALDWHHTESLHLAKSPSGKTEFVELAPGRWPTIEMGEADAVRRFERLESIKWLKFKPYLADLKE